MFYRLVRSFAYLTWGGFGRENAFRGGIRARDSRCVISGVVNRSAPYR